MGVGIGWRDEGCTSRGVRKKRHPVGWRFLERATGKAAQRRQWRMQQAAFKAAPRLADTNVAARRLAQRGQEAAQRRQWRMQQAAFKAAPRLADTNVAARRLAQRGNHRSAACGR